MKISDNYNYNEIEDFSINYYNIDKLYNSHKRFRQDFFLFIEIRKNNKFTYQILKKYFPIIRKIDRIIYNLLDKINTNDNFNLLYQMNVNSLIYIIEQNNKRFLSNYSLMNDNDIVNKIDIFSDESVDNEVYNELPFIIKNGITGGSTVANEAVNEVYTMITVNDIDNGIDTIYLKE